MRVKDRTQTESRQCEQYRLESGLPVFKVIDDTDVSDPFLLFDHIGPVVFQPGEAVGAPDHPHRGMELISVLLQGSVHHADSIGHDGVLPAGTVQHIRFGRGLVHFEMPGPSLVQAGGVLEGYQIWVNLPPAQKLCTPAYTELAPDDVPRVRTEDGGAEIRVLCGSSHGVDGAVACLTPVLLLDVRLTRRDASVVLDVPDQYESAFAYCFGGAGASVGGRALPVNWLARLGQGESLTLAATQEPCHLLVGAGVPLREPVVKYGPFAMSSEEEIRDAVRDFRQGLMGECPPPGAQARQASIEAALALQRANGRDV